MLCNGRHHFDYDHYGLALEAIDPEKRCEGALRARVNGVEVVV